MQAHAYEQIIIAGGDEDVSSIELFDWIAPLLAGIPGGRWVSCQLERGPGNEILACYREGSTGRILNMALDGSAAGTREMMDQLPNGNSFTLVMLNDFASQAVTLLDGIAHWLNIYDTAANEVKSVLALLAALTKVLAGT